MPVKLREVTNGMERVNEEWLAHIHRKTGEIVELPIELLGQAEDGDESDDSEFEPQDLEDAKRVIADADFIRLPRPETRDEYALMEEFVAGIKDENLRELFEVAIAGKGAFRRFKDTAHRKGFLDAWYAKKNASLEDTARAFLIENGIAFEE